MYTNPYEAPQSQTTRQPKLIGERAKALRDVRLALLILLVPAIYNFICFNFPANLNQIELLIYRVYRTTNSIGFILIVLAIWFFGLVMLELITGGVHSLFARKSTPDDWKAVLYLTLRRAPVFALLGAVLWGVWVFAFYQLGVDFYTVSVPIGVAAHLLAACLYVPLIYRWYKMERSAADQTAT